MSAEERLAQDLADAMLAVVGEKPPAILVENHRRIAARLAEAGWTRVTVKTTTRLAAVRACEGHYEDRHVTTTPPCAEAVRDAEWWADALGVSVPTELGAPDLTPDGYDVRHDGPPAPITELREELDAEMAGTEDWTEGPDDYLDIRIGLVRRIRAALANEGGS